MTQAAGIALNLSLGALIGDFRSLAAGRLLSISEGRDLLRSGWCDVFSGSRAAPAALALGRGWKRCPAFGYSRTAFLRFNSQDILGIFVLFAAGFVSLAHVWGLCFVSVCLLSTRLRILFFFKVGGFF